MKFSCYSWKMGKLRGKKVAMKKDIENGGKISRYLEE